MLYNNLNYMCDTVLKQTSEYGEPIGEFLRWHLTNGNITPPTASRLLGHVNQTWVDEKVLEMLYNRQEDRAKTRPDRFVAPILRSVDDFDGARRVVLHLHRAWHVLTRAVFDSTDQTVTGIYDEVTSITTDVRSPALWLPEEFTILTARKRTRHTACMFGAQILLTAFAQHPHLPEEHIRTTLRKGRLGPYPPKKATDQ